MERKTRIIIAAFIIVALIIISAFWVYANWNIAPPRHYPPPYIEFEIDVSSGDGWLNLTVTDWDWDVGNIKWSDLELRSRDNKSNYNFTILEGPKPPSNLMENEWGHSGEDDIVDIIEKLHIHAVSNTTIYFVHVPTTTLVAYEQEVD